MNKIVQFLRKHKKTIIDDVIVYGTFSGIILTLRDLAPWKVFVILGITFIFGLHNFFEGKRQGKEEIGGIKNGKN